MPETHQVACQESRGRVSVTRMPVHVGTPLFRCAATFVSMAKRLFALYSIPVDPPASPVCLR